LAKIWRGDKYLNYNKQTSLLFQTNLNFQILPNYVMNVNGFLYIASAKVEDSGEYECYYLTNDASETVTLKIVEEDESETIVDSNVTESKENTTIVVNNNVHLTTSSNVTAVSSDDKKEEKEKLPPPPVQSTNLTFYRGENIKIICDAQSDVNDLISWKMPDKVSKKFIF
jgi:hypothetical protein